MAPQSYQLVMRSGPNPGKSFLLDKEELIIGRESTNDIVINDAEISRKHTRLVQLPGGGFMVEDLGSTNGTFVNGQRLMGPHTLRNGELIMLGENISLVYEMAGYDVDATMVSGPGMPVDEPPTYAPAAPFKPEPVSYGVPDPVYAEPVPQGPAVYEAPPVRRSGSRTWVLAGCGCLLVLCCVLAAAGYAFDAANMYCSPPFDIFFSCP